MKMENELRAPRDGEVTQVKVQPGDSVEKNQVLLVISE
jgi:biotin carboxyl carrier protein